MRRLVLALWGYIPDDVLPYWEEKFSVNTCTGEEAQAAVTDGQIERVAESPLRLTTIHMHAVRASIMGADIPYIWVLPA